MGIFSKTKEKPTADIGESKGWYKLISRISIIGAFVAVAILVFSITGIISFSSFLFGIMGTILIISLGAIMLLPWMKKIDKNYFKKTSIVFTCLIAAAILLWVICLWLGVSLYQKTKAGTSSVDDLTSLLNFLKVTIILSLQFIISSVIGQTIIEYQKKSLTFQAITYLSYLFIDFYFTFLLACISIKTDKISFNDNISLLWSKIMIALILLSVFYVAISNAVIKARNTKRMRDATDHILEQKQPAPKTESVETKLENLKNLLDKNLITQAEYDERKAKILEDL